MLENGSISKVCHSKEEYLSSLFLISRKVRGNRPIINVKDLNRFILYKNLRMEGLHCLKYLFAEWGLHVQSRPERCILQCFSTQSFTKFSKVSFVRKLVRVPVTMLWFGTSCQNIQEIIKGSNLSFEISDDKDHSLSRQFIDFRK